MIHSFTEYEQYDFIPTSTYISGFNQLLSGIFSQEKIVLLSLFILLLFLVLYVYIFIKNYLKARENNILLFDKCILLENQIEELQLQNNTLQKAESELKVINTTKDRFFSIISHDLRGPLNSITGLLQIVIGYTNSFSKEELQGFANTMDKSVRNSLDLLQNLLHWAQTQTGQLEYRPQKLALHTIVTDTVNLLEVAASNKDIVIDTAIDKDLTTYADADMLSFTLRNLIHNAIKFTYIGGKVNILAIIRENNIIVEVSDNGKGISQQDIGKLFKIDTCYTTNGTAKEIGTGLGLILCNEFVEKNGGNITVESELKKGTTFRFTLPFIKQPSMIINSLSSI